MKIKINKVRKIFLKTHGLKKKILVISKDKKVLKLIK